MRGRDRGDSAGKVEVSLAERVGVGVAGPVGWIFHSRNGSWGAGGDGEATSVSEMFTPWGGARQFGCI
ncbi:hypothetical protein C0Z10_11070 [Acidipropionibacterium jensenii]|uniref:Uncharacterized protein n=1 Tax=Acidipropionibacterium jensenii TaxID=1749 RepID=A0A3Q9UKT0_9ACTN|nr:hypothetical protein C0Z10_11070 [Acidipropionibacterium jensenii]